MNADYSNDPIEITMLQSALPIPLLYLLLGEKVNSLTLDRLRWVNNELYYFGYDMVGVIVIVRVFVFVRVIATCCPVTSKQHDEFLLATARISLSLKGLKSNLIRERYDDRFQILLD